MGNQSWIWGNNVNLGDSVVGWHSAEISGLASNTTYHARIKASNEIGETWFGPITWTTDNDQDYSLIPRNNSSRLNFGQ